ncbi:peptidoglycan recognition protein family protein [Streptomyces griseoincarnatus]
MAWYPGAVKMELQPESDAQPAIRPTQLIVHSIVAPWTARRTYEYWRDSTNLESHFGLGYKGDLAQYIGTETRADANAGANRRADGTGAVSVETASNTSASDEWTAAQVEELIKLGVWMHQKHGVPLRICRSHSDPGFGYHSLFPQWSTSGTACPGKARIAQFKKVVFPGIVARAKGTAPAPSKPAPTPPKETDMATPYELWAYKGRGEDRDAYAYLRGTNADVKTLAKQMDALSDKVAGLEQRPLTDDQVAAIAAAVAAHPALAQAIADTLATRLKD